MTKLITAAIAAIIGFIILGSLVFFGFWFLIFLIAMIPFFIVGAFLGGKIEINKCTVNGKEATLKEAKEAIKEALEDE